MDDNQPSPWWPCPECGSVHFRTITTFERGKWAEDCDEYRPFDPPDGIPSCLESDVECASCGHEFNIARYYEWPVNETPYEASI